MKIMSLILAMLLIGGSLVNSMMPVKAADVGMISETIEEEEVSIEEYREILIRDGYTPEEADAKINSHVATRGPLVNLYKVTKIKRRQIEGGYSLRCQVGVYVWRDEDYGNVEIDHATAPYIGLEGTLINQEYSGSIEATSTSQKVTVDYNGVIKFFVTGSVSIGFATQVGAIGGTKEFQYWVNGQFNWNLSEI